MNTVIEATIGAIQDINGGIKITFNHPNGSMWYNFRMISEIDRFKLKKLEEYAGDKGSRILGKVVRLVSTEDIPFAAFGHPTIDRFVKTYEAFSDIQNTYPKSADVQEYVLNQFG